MVDVVSPIAFFTSSSMRCVTRTSPTTETQPSDTNARARERKRKARAAMTEEERTEELTQARRRRANALLTKEVVTSVNAHTAQLHTIKSRILERGQSRLSGAALAELVCCVCDCLHEASRVKTLKVEHNRKLREAMSSRLKAPPNLPKDILLHYSVAEIVPDLHGALLSKRGVSVSEGCPIFQVCASCRSSLVDKARSHPPKFAVANGLYVGQLPSKFEDTTLTENAMMNLSQPLHYISVVRGGKHSSLRSHAYFFRADPAPPTLLLPRDVISSGVVGVTLVGALTPAQKAATLKKYDVRVPRLRDQMCWYQHNNHLYSTVKEQPEWEVAASVARTRVVIDSTESCTVQTLTGREESLDDGPHELDQSTWRHNAPLPAHVAVDNGDEECEQSSIGLISDFAHVDATTGVEHALRGKGVVVYRSSSILSDFDPVFWVHAFCDLFPYGRGGLDEPRAVPISLLEFVRYCLRLSSRCYARHPSFSLVAFDVVARHNALQAIYIKARMSPQVMSSAASVPREVLEEYVAYQQERLLALTQMRPVRDQPQVDERLKDMFASISSGMQAFWGSNEERANDRKDLFSLQLQYGQPTIFFTLSPDSSSTFRVGNFAGAVPRSVLDNVEVGLQECLIFTRARLGQIATANPYICAKFFDIVMTTFIEVVLGWDTENQCSRHQPGLFGRTRAFYASTESQSSTGSLHSHMLIWIEGMPSTVESYYNMCAVDAFRGAMVDYIDGLVTSDVPLDMQSCLKCERGRIEPVHLQQRAFKKHQPGAKRPPTVRCGSCGTSFGADELIVGHAERVEVQASAPIVTEDTVFRDVASSISIPCEPDRRSVEAARVARSLLYYQHHHWFHAKSCFKVTRRTPKGNVCRMFFPKEACLQTQWTSGNVIEIKRSPGNEYINTYSPVVNSIFKCNHDVRFLSAGEGPEKAFYMMKYATKPQQSLENPLALHLHAYDRAKQRIGDDLDDPSVAGRRIAQSMCCNLSNPHEVSAPMASLYLLRGGAVYSSHKFVKLHLKSVLNAVFVEDQVVDVLLESDTNKRQFTPLGVWLDYMHRPSNLEGLSLMKFVEAWERRKSRHGARFGRSHPLFETHSLYRRAVDRIVVVCQKRLPDTRHNDRSSEDRLRFEQSVMVLFRPFRALSDLISNAPSFADSFKAWWSNDPPAAARTFVENNNDYYASRELAKQTQDADISRYSAYEGDSDGYLDVAFDESASEDEMADESHDYDIEDGMMLPDRPTKHVDMLSGAQQVAELIAVSAAEGPNSDSLVTMRFEDVQECIRAVENAEAGLESPVNHAANILSDYPDLPTRVSLLKAATEGANESSMPACSVDERNHDPAELPSLPSIREVSAAFGLNLKQNRMFASAGSKLLASILIEHKPSDQMVAFLGGLPGAGKSRVIAALQCLALKWNSPEAIATAAYQGVAAQSANGQTIHKLFGWFVTPKKQWVPTQQQRERFAQLKLLILDEVSTIDVKILGMVDQSLRKLLNRPGHVFGGVHVLLVGDWLQQLPVAGQPAFQHPSQSLHSSSKRKDEYLNRVRGANAYQSINCVVMLTENMRHRLDPVWRDILDKWRVGQYDHADVDLVNKLAADANWTAPQTVKGYCPVIVTSNALRVEFNGIALRAYCKQAEVPLHRFPGDVSRKRHPLSAAQQRSLQNVRDDKTNGMPTMLELAIGSQAQCTKNVSMRLKLANGSIGTVVGFTPARDDVVRVRNIDGIPEHTHSQPPAVVFLKLKDYPTQSFSAQLPLGVVPVTRRVERGICISMARRTFSVTVAQVPLVPAYSLTTEKCQGLTVEKMILAPLRHQTRRIPQRSSLYVAVTRVKSLQEMYMMAPLTKSYLSYFKPNEQALSETLRLHELEEKHNLDHMSHQIANRK